MISDRHMLVVRQEWIVRPEDLADIGRVMDPHVEIGVITDPRREMQHAFRCPVQYSVPDPLNALAVRPFNIK